jgi:hypothetical protein
MSVVLCSESFQRARRKSGVNDLKGVYNSPLPEDDEEDHNGEPLAPPAIQKPASRSWARGTPTSRDHDGSAQMKIERTPTPKAIEA